MLRRAVRIGYILAFWGAVTLGGGFGLEAQAYEGLAGQQARAVEQDTVSPVRFDIDVAAGNSRIREEGSEAAQYVTLGFLPEIYYRRLGIGLLLRLRLHAGSGAVRDEDFDDFRDYLAILYFIEYGEEEDPQGYGRFGNIEEVSLGYGLFVDRYTNEVSLDDPMRGFTGALATDRIRLEGVYGDFAEPGVFGLHAAYFPFGVDTTASAPRMTLGAALAGELRGSAAFVNPVTPGAPFVIDPSRDDTLTTDVSSGVRDDDLYMVGVDAGIRWIRAETFSVLTFAEVAKILDYGAGAALGVRGTSELGRVRLQAQYVQRFLGKEFLPDYFGSTYEAERIQRVSLPDGEAGEIEAVNTRRNQLAGRQRSGLGYQVRLRADYADAFESTVGYETIWGASGSDRFYLDVRLHAPDVPLSVRLGYDRFSVEVLEDSVTPSEDDALYRLGLAYQVMEPIRLGVDVRQTYEPIYRSSGYVIGQRKQNRIEPFVQVVWRF